MTTDVTIVIPHFRAAVLADCLESVYAHSDPQVRVIVVDDGQNAPSLQQAQRRFPQVEVLRNARNLGFSASCNRGLDAVESPYAVLLNDDTRVTANWLPPLLEAAAEDPSLAACQPKLLAATDPQRFDYGGAAGGYIDRLGFVFCRGRIFAFRERDTGQYDRPVSLFWACGSALFLRTEAVRHVGGLDLDYFMHFEEIDLCWRLQLAGYRIQAAPASVVYHHSGFSLPPRSFRKTYLNHRNNLAMLCKNLDATVLLWVLPVRILLDLAATLTYLLQREWSSVPAPIAGLSWLLSHPLQLLRRRRQSRSLLAATGRASARLRGPGTYPGSITWQYFVHGTRRASALMNEEEAS